MKVYLGFLCSYDFCNNYEHVQEVFANEEDALDWVIKFETVYSDDVEVEWREYREYNVI